MKQREGVGFVLDPMIHFSPKSGWKPGRGAETGGCGARRGKKMLGKYNNLEQHRCAERRLFSGSLVLYSAV